MMIRRKQQDTAKGHSKKEWRDTGEKNQTDIQRKGVAGMDEEMVLCAASAYERKFYLNPEFILFRRSEAGTADHVRALYGRCGLES